ncbi:DUF572-domain-containing protein [Zopfia rhizophila CBS 207.26]|uniref:DUF572-domain-containing protein n=1 Tax=Zopfia rhizophila CBS 207.26 TaxID=1314779 RepID=A0A6A6ER47_9PEZI|nr:DUF572-domain-containing protein [Zopfia rhizophila CBS 207.26]
MQGFNMGRYYPPDPESAPHFNTSHPLGSRARKINQGILTVRFELPFAVWCSHCKPEALIGQGVRFNAEKKKVGNYYSTPIWSFRIKHTACGGWLDIRTDPKNTEYVVVEGGKRRDYGPEEKGEGELSFLTEEEREKRRNDAFAALEGRMDEKGMEKKNRERVEELYEENERAWRDPYEANRKLRRDFRVQRKFLQKEEKHKEGIQDKFGIGFEIADEIEGDRVRASLVGFGVDESSDRKVEEAAKKPLFAMRDPNKAPEKPSKTKKLKSKILAEKSKDNLQQALLGNTRAVLDPFLTDNARSSPKTTTSIIPGLKRKRTVDSDTVSDVKDTDVSPPEAEQQTPAKKSSLLGPLVDYDSD